MRRFFVPLMTLALTSMVAAEPALKAASGWIREAPPMAPVRAGYLALTNEADAEIAIVGARSEAFGAVEIHEMVASDDGTMRMRPVPRLAIPAGGKVELAPGGLHFMLFRPQRTLSPGTDVPLVLVMEDGATIETTLKQR